MKKTAEEILRTMIWKPKEISDCVDGGFYEYVTKGDAIKAMQEYASHRKQQIEDKIKGMIEKKANNKIQCYKDIKRSMFATSLLNKIALYIKYTGQKEILEKLLDEIKEL